MLKTFEQKVPQRSDTAAAAIMNYFAKTWGLGGHLALAKRTPGIELLSQKVSAKMSAAAKNYLLNVLLSLFNCLFIVWFPPFYPISCLLNVLLSLFNCLLKRKNEKRRDFAKLLSGVCTQPTFDDDDDIENCDHFYEVFDEVGEDDGDNHTWYLSFFLHKHNFRLNFSPHKNA